MSIDYRLQRASGRQGGCDRFADQMGDPPLTGQGHARGEVRSGRLLAAEPSTGTKPGVSAVPC